MTEDTTDTETSIDSDDSDDAGTDAVIRDAETPNGANPDSEDTDGESVDETPTDDSDSASDRENDARRHRESRRRRGRNGGTWSEAGLHERLQWVALVVLVLVAISTLFLFYTNVSRLISIWASRRYAPAFQAAFALAVLASALAGITWLSRDLY